MRSAGTGGWPGGGPNRSRRGADEQVCGRLIRAISCGMFVAGPYVPYSCHPLECSAPRRAPILHVGDAMAERVPAAPGGASKSVSVTGGRRAVAATKTATVRTVTATAKAARTKKAAPARKAAPVGK